MCDELFNTMILSRDLFKSDFSVKKRHRDVFKPRDNNICLSAYGARNPVVYQQHTSKAMVGWEARLYRSQKTSNLSHISLSEQKPVLKKCVSVRANVALSATGKLNFEGGSTRCGSTIRTMKSTKSVKKAWM